MVEADEELEEREVQEGGEELEEEAEVVEELSLPEAVEMMTMTTTTMMMMTKVRREVV